MTLDERLGVILAAVLNWHRGRKARKGWVSL